MTYGRLNSSDYKGNIGPVETNPNPLREVPTFQKRVLKIVTPVICDTQVGNAWSNPNRPIGPHHKGGFTRAQTMSQHPLNAAYLNPNRPAGPRR